MLQEIHASRTITQGEEITVTCKRFCSCMTENLVPDRAQTSIRSSLTRIAEMSCIGTGALNAPAPSALHLSMTKPSPIPASDSFVKCHGSLMTKVPDALPGQHLPSCWSACSNRRGSRPALPMSTRLWSMRSLERRGWRRSTPEKASKKYVCGMAGTAITIKLWSAFSEIQRGTRLGSISRGRKLEGSKAHYD